MSEKRQIRRQAEVEDPSDYNQRKRLEAISHARTVVTETYRQAQANGKTGEKGARAVHAAVTAFIQEIEWLVGEHGDRTYYEAPVGEVVIEPPVDEKVWTNRHADSPISLTGDGMHKANVHAGYEPQPKKHAITGILTDEATGPGFLDFPVIVSASWDDVLASVRHKGDKVWQASASELIPMQVSMQAFRMGTRFLADFGLDARSSDESDRDGGSW